MDEVKPLPTAPLGVFAAGTWTYCGQKCRESELDKAAYVAYRPFLADRDRLLDERERLTRERERLMREITVDEQRVADMMADVARVSRERDEARALLREIRETSADHGRVAAMIDVVLARAEKEQG